MINSANINIKLNDLLKLSDADIKISKVRFNQTSPDANPMELYLQDPEMVNSQWFLWRTTQRYFHEGQIAVCLLKIRDDTWLLTTIKRIIKDLDVVNGINYEAEELEQYRQYYGRVIVKYHKTFQSQGVYLEKIVDDLIVNQILPTTYDGVDFPGYDKVRLSYPELLSIIQMHKKDWVTALESQKAVYLITDKSNGKLYVGSATSDKGMLLSRWESYAQNGHGGNVNLKELVAKEGMGYVRENFQYSILENYNSKVEDDLILDRESWWKETLQTRKYGYNAN